MTFFNFSFFFQFWGRETEHPIFSKLRCWAVSDRASDRARRPDSNALSLASRGPLHPIFEAFLFFDCFFILGFTFLAPHDLTK